MVAPVPSATAPRDRHSAGRAGRGSPGLLLASPAYRNQSAPESWGGGDSPREPPVGVRRGNGCGHAALAITLGNTEITLPPGSAPLTVWFVVKAQNAATNRLKCDRVALSRPGSSLSGEALPPSQVAF